MARIAYEDDFLEKLKDSTKKVIGIGAVAFLMSGCQSTSTQEPIQSLESNQEIHSEYQNMTIMERAAAAAPQVTIDNYEEILENKLSGVYQHPVYEDQIVTYQFAEDPESEMKVKKDLMKYGLDPSYFDTEQRLYELVTNDDDNTSRHVQNYFGDKSNDINLCKIFSSNYISSKLPTTSDDFKDFGFSIVQEAPTAEEIEKSQKLTKYRGYNLLMHEAGHSLEHQQMGALDYLVAPFSHENLIMLENSSEAFATLKTIQLMAQEGESKELIEEMTESRIKLADSITLNQLGGHDHDVHQFIPTAHIIDDLVKSDLDFVLELDKNQLDKVAEIISKNAVESDYTDMYNKTAINKLEPKLDKLLQGLSETPKEKILKMKDNISNMLFDDEFRSEKLRLEAEEVHSILSVTSEYHYELSENKPSAFKHVKSEISQRVSENMDGLEIDDFNPAMLLIDDYSELHVNINNDLENAGITPPKMFEEMGQLKNSSLSHSQANDHDHDHKHEDVKSKSKHKI